MDTWSLVSRNCAAEGVSDVCGYSVCPVKRQCRHTSSVLGGKYQEGNWDTSFSAEDARGILDRCAALVPAVKDKETKILRHNVGLRPARKGGPRVEAEWINVPRTTDWITADASASTATGRVLVVHAYGFGWVVTVCAWRNVVTDCLL